MLYDGRSLIKVWKLGKMSTNIILYLLKFDYLRFQLANWIKYGKWEESIGELQRSRSVFERALDVDHRSITIWLQYAEMEMRFGGFW